MSNWRIEKKNLSSGKVLTSNSILQLQKLTMLLEDAIPAGRKLLKDIPVDHFKETRFIKVNILERHINRIEVIIFLLSQWEKRPSVEDSIGLIIRGCLSDVISEFYIEDLHYKVKTCPSPEEEVYLKATSSFLADHVRAGLSYNKALTDAGVFSKEYSKESIDRWKALYPPYFDTNPINYDNPLKNILPQPFPKAAQIIKSIRNSEMLQKFNLDDLYINYFYYSKYEHFGVTTNHIQNSDMNMSFYVMMESLSYVLLSCQILSIHLEDDNNKFFSQFHSEHKIDTQASEKFFSVREEFVRILNANRPEEYAEH